MWNFCALGVSACFLLACGPGDPKKDWEPIVEPTEGTFLSGVWGSSPDDVYIVGGNRSFGEIRHFDGSEWSTQTFDGDRVFVWIHGFGPDDIYAVGENGTARHYDGESWKPLDVPTTDDLWGIWGPSPTDMWLVGGSINDGDPLLMHYDGETFTPYALPAAENALNAHSLFKVWGIGGTIYAVGQFGLVLQYDGSEWKRVLAGENADDDFIALSGTSTEDVYLAGGRATARIGVHQGSVFETLKPEAISGLSAVFADSHGVFFGGLQGEVLRFDPATREVEIDDFLPSSVHALWGDGEGTLYAVGGFFGEPFTAIAYKKDIR